MDCLWKSLLVVTSLVTCGFNHFFVYGKSEQNRLSKEVRPVIILGGGIAGLSAAICLKQEGVNPIVIEGAKPGGELVFAQLVRNWPGKKNARGVEVVDDIREHALSLNIPILEEEVVSVDFSQRPYTIKTQDFDDGKDHEYQVQTCVVAMGSEPSLLNIPGESGPDGYLGRGVNTCVWCDGPLYQDSERVAVIGGGQGAIFNALHMADIAQEVVVLVQGDSFTVKDSRNLDRLLKKKNVRILFNTQALEVKGNGDSVTHLVIRDQKSGVESDLVLDGVFLAIGSRPKTALFQEYLELSNQGGIVLKNYQETSKEGIFAAGEICQNKFSQAIVSASQGCVAALQVKTFLEEHGIQKISRAYGERDREWIWNSDGMCRQVYRGDISSGGSVEIGSLKDFENLVVNNNRLVAVDFYSPYCPACKYMMPVFDELAQTYKGKIDCVKINMTKLDSRNFVSRIQGAHIKSMPTFVFVRNGKEIERITHFKSKDDLRNVFAKYR